MTVPGQLRRSQVITTWGPGALIDLPRHSGIVGGLDGWPQPLTPIVERRLTHKIQAMTRGVEPKLFAPPSADPAAHRRTGIGVWRFPEWFVVQDARREDRSRRLINVRSLDANGRFEGQPVVATRFVMACPRGHVAATSPGSPSRTRGGPAPSVNFGWTSRAPAATSPSSSCAAPAGPSHAACRMHP